MRCAQPCHQLCSTGTWDRQRSECMSDCCRTQHVHHTGDVGKMRAPEDRLRDVPVPHHAGWHTPPCAAAPMICATLPEKRRSLCVDMSDA